MRGKREGRGGVDRKGSEATTETAGVPLIHPHMVHVLFYYCQVGSEANNLIVSQ